MSNTGPYQYGRALGALKRDMERFAEQIAKGFADAYNGRPLTLEQREAISERRYRRRIESERLLGLAHVDRVARQARRDLGLEPRP